MYGQLIQNINDAAFVRYDVKQLGDQLNDNGAKRLSYNLISTNEKALNPLSKEDNIKALVRYLRAKLLNDNDEPVYLLNPYHTGGRGSEKPW